MSELGGFMTMPVVVRTKLGEGSRGPQHDQPAVVDCLIAAGRRIVRGPDGEQTLSETTLFAPTTTAGQFTTGSRVTLPNNTTATVIVAKHHQSPAGMDLPESVEVALT